MSFPESMLADWFIRGIALSVAAAAAYALLRPGGRSRGTLLAVTTAGLLLLPFALWAAPKWTLGWISLPVSGFGAADEFARYSGEGAGWIMILWLAGTAACLARLGIGIWALGKIRTVKAEDAVLHCASWAAEKLGTATPEIVLSENGHGPFATGLLRARVVLPKEAKNWSPAILRSVLLHEMAHLKRGDLWMQGVGNAVCALYWFNPLVWFLHRWLAKEREFLADTLVVECGTSPRGYARALLDVAESGWKIGGGATVAVGLAGSSQLEERIRRLMGNGSGHPGGKAGGALLVGLVAVAGAACLDPFASPPPAEAPDMKADPSGAGEKAENWTEEEIGRRFSASPFPGS